jgi:hypothetical protein
MTKLIVAFHNFATCLKKMPAFYDTTLLKLEAADFSETSVLIYETAS